MVSKLLYNIVTVTGVNAHGSLKKRAAPMPPMYGTLPSNSSHSRTPSDPLLQLQGYHTLSHHKRSPSSESGSHASPLAASGNRGSIPSAIHLGNGKYPCYLNLLSASILFSHVYLC